MTADLDEAMVLGVLTWSAAHTGYLDELADAWTAIRADRFERAVAGLPATDRLVAARLAPDAIERILRAPDWPDVRSTVYGEFLRQGGRSAVPPGTVPTTATGDLVYPVDGGGPGAILAGEVAVDGRSPHALASYAGIGAPGAEHHRHAAAGVSAVTDALDRLPAAIGAFVGRMTQVLLVRTGGAGFGSSSWPALVGCAAVTNPQLAEPAQLVELIVHESVHGFLYRLEATTRPWFGSADARSAARLPSPWTGRLLAPHSFVHAVLVWYALGHLWRRASGPGAAERAAAARVGFRAPDALTATVTRIDGLTTPVRRLLAQAIATAP